MTYLDLYKLCKTGFSASCALGSLLLTITPTKLASWDSVRPQPGLASTCPSRQRKEAGRGLPCRLPFPPGPLPAPPRPDCATGAPCRRVEAVLCARRSARGRELAGGGLSLQQPEVQDVHGRPQRPQSPHLPVARMQSPGPHEGGRKDCGQ